jgi:uncharacterized protein (TIGR03083 family)
MADTVDTRSAAPAGAPLPIDIDWDLAKERVRDAAHRLPLLMRSTTDPDRTAIGYWTVGDLSAHLTQVFANFSLMARGGQSPMTDHLKLAEKHDDYLREHPERDPHVLADDVEKSLNEILDAVETMQPNDTVSWHGGIQVPIVVLLALILDEAIVHGWDLAQAEHRDWPIAPLDAVISLKGLMSVAPNFLTDEGKAAELSFGVKLRTDGTVTFRFSNGTATVSSFDEGPVDCRISAAPVELLMVGAGRIGQWGPVLKGKVVAYGKKPWLGLKFTKLFRDP